MFLKGKKKKGNIVLAPKLSSDDLADTDNYVSTNLLILRKTDEIFKVIFICFQKYFYLTISSGFYSKQSISEHLT